MWQLLRKMSWTNKQTNSYFINIDTENVFLLYNLLILCKKSLKSIWITTTVWDGQWWSWCWCSDVIWLVDFWSTWSSNDPVIQVIKSTMSIQWLTGCLIVLQRREILFQKSWLLFLTWREYFCSQPTLLSRQPKK